MILRRRAFLNVVLASCVTGGVAGCLGTEHADDLWLSNESGSPQRVSIRVTRLSNEEERLNETVTLEAGASKEYPEVAGEYNCRVNVNVHDGPSNERVWRDSSSDSYTLHITIDESSITFKEAAV